MSLRKVKESWNQASHNYGDIMAKTTQTIDIWEDFEQKITTIMQQMKSSS